MAGWLEALFPITEKKTSEEKPPLQVSYIALPRAKPRTEPGQGYVGTVAEGGDFGDRLPLWFFKATKHVSSGLPHPAP